MTIAIEVEVSRSYREIRKPDEQYDFGTFAIAKLIANAASFPALPIPATGLGTTLTSINNTYLTKINLAKGGDHDAIIDRDSYRDEVWIPAFDDTADYVETIADHEETIINLSGFKPTKPERERATLPSKMSIDVKSVNVGEIDYSSDTKDIGKDPNYLLIMGGRGLTNFTQDADGKIIIETTGATKIVVAPLRKKKGKLRGLPSDERMNVVMFAINAAGAGPLSQEAKITIQ